MTSLELLREFSQLGCKDQSKTALACRVYQQLLAAQKYSGLDRAYDKDLDVFYVIAYDNSNSESRHIFLPLLSTQSLEMPEMEFVQTKLKALYDGCTIHLAICDTASNILFYTLTAGFLDDVNNMPRKR